MFVLLVGLFIIGLLLNPFPAGAVTAGVATPGTVLDRASALGLTSFDTRSSNGIRLEGGRVVYYFTFTLETASNASFWFYTDQKTSAKGIPGVVTVFNSSRRPVSGSQASDGSTKYSNLAAGTYYISVDISKSGASTGWLSWKADKFDGSQPSSALAWYSRSDLYAQMPAETRSQWYKVNMSAGQKGSLKLYGDRSTNLNVYLYTDTSTSRPFASGTLTSYPESFTFTVPSGARAIYVQVDNAGKSSTEYTIQLNR
jgi:hypothetical protein